MALYELAQRNEAGLTVRLLWDSLRDRVIVRYCDTHIEDAFEAEVPKAKALFAFEHPNSFRAAA
jgi:hypothetical protein